MLSRTMHKNNFKKDSPAACFFFRLFFVLAIYRSPGTLLKEEQAKNRKRGHIRRRRSRKLRNKERGTNLCFSFGPPVDCCFCYAFTNDVAVREDFAGGTGTSRSLCYLERNTSRGGEVSRKVVNRKNEIICKQIRGSPLQQRHSHWTQLRCGPLVLHR